jgi:hypothetical protein
MPAQEPVRGAPTSADAACKLLRSPSTKRAIRAMNGADSAVLSLAAAKPDDALTSLDKLNRSVAPSTRSGRSGVSRGNPR